MANAQRSVSTESDSDIIRAEAKVHVISLEHRRLDKRIDGLNSRGIRDEETTRLKKLRLKQKDIITGANQRLGLS